MIRKGRDFILKHVEVSIEKKDSKYQASCAMFPDCVGIGRTEKEALSKLSTAISQFIAKTAKKTFNHIFSSQNFTEVILDLSKKQTSTSRIFSLFQPNEVPNFDLGVKPQFEFNDDFMKETKLQSPSKSENSAPDIKTLFNDHPHPMVIFESPHFNGEFIELHLNLN